MRVVFPYFAQLHQILHSLPIAAAMAARYPEIEVRVAGTEPRHLQFAESLLRRFAPDAPLQLDLLKPVMFRRWPHKKRTMIRNRYYFRGFDAIVTPERTSLYLRRLGLGSTQLIWTRHGAGDRAIGFASDVRHFDYVLVAGRKIEQRLLRAGQIRAGHYRSGVYAKFDWLGGEREPLRLFDNQRPTVLYNPHFDPGLSSWPRFGRALLDFFAASERYNLIFAPHVRLFDAPSAARHAAFDRYRGLPHLHIDLGSERSVDMSYVNAADVYLGDVSSQAAEFVVRPRPCLFLDAHGADWRGNPDYGSWVLGPVLGELGNLGACLQQAIAGHAAYLQAQRQYLAETFGVLPGEASALRGAEAIVDYLCRSAGAPCAAAPARDEPAQIWGSGTSRYGGAIGGGVVAASATSPARR